MASRVVLLGCGGVGRVLVEMMLKQKVFVNVNNINKNGSMVVAAVADSKHLLTAAGSDGQPNPLGASLDADTLAAVVAAKAGGSGLLPLAGPRVAVQDLPAGMSALLAAIAAAGAPAPGAPGGSGPARFIFADCSASDDAAPHLAALRLGCGLVLGNKKPVSGPLSTFEELMACPERIRLESTVGAGLPVHAALARLQLAGDEVRRVAGAFSGTLGYVMSGLEEGRAFSEVVLEAKRLGFTEPDPRDDLSGQDVARKALILARRLGWRLEPSAVEVESLFPEHLGAVSLSEFLQRLPELDAAMAARVAACRARGMALRYAAVIEAGRVTVGPTEVPADSPLGRLRGTANLVELHSAAFENGLVIAGAGAGGAVTAAGILADIHELHRARW